MCDLHGWQQYPENLASNLASGLTARCSWDLDEYNQALHDDAARLFGSDKELQVKVIEIEIEKENQVLTRESLRGIPDYVFGDVGSFENYLRKSYRSLHSIRIFLIPQQYSWSNLAISEEATRKLLTSLRAFPPFLDVLHVFGQKTGRREDSIGGYQDLEATRGESLECCYLVKHMELHGRVGPSDPWSMRQIGVYHKQDSAHDRHTFIIINPSKPFQKRLKKVIASGRPQWQDIHNLLHSSVTSRWRKYVDYLDEELEIVKSKAQLAAVNQTDGHIERAECEIHFSDAQEIHIIQDKVCQLRHVLQMNYTTFEAIGRRLSESGTSLTHTNDCIERQLSKLSRPYIIQTEAELHRIQTMLRRLKAASELIRSILDFYGLDALQGSGRTATRIAQLAQHDNKLMIDLTQKSRRDNFTVRTITIMTLVYLPASFASTMLSMGYISVSSGAHGVSIHFAGEMIIFGVLTVVLLLLTIGTWKVLDQRQSKFDAYQQC